MFRFAKISGAGNGNPADGLSEVMVPVPSGKRWPAIVDIVHLRELVRDVDHVGANPVTQKAMRTATLACHKLLEVGVDDATGRAKCEADLDAALTPSMIARIRALTK